MGTDYSTIVTAIGIGLSAIAALGGIIANIAIYRGQSHLVKELHESQKLLSKRQLLIPLWQYISTLAHIDQNNPIEPDVLKVVNTLELVALSCEGGMVDAAVIKRTFRNLFLQLYDEIQMLPKLKGLGKSGIELLKENPAAMKFYKELEVEHINRETLTP